MNFYNYFEKDLKLKAEFNFIKKEEDVSISTLEWGFLQLFLRDQGRSVLFISDSNLSDKRKELINSLIPKYEAPDNKKFERLNETYSNYIKDNSPYNSEEYNKRREEYSYAKWEFFDEYYLFTNNELLSPAVIHDFVEHRRYFLYLSLDSDKPIKTSFLNKVSKEIPFVISLYEEEEKLLIDVVINDKDLKKIAGMLNLFGYKGE